MSRNSAIQALATAAAALAAAAAALIEVEPEAAKPAPEPAKPKPAKVAAVPAVKAEEPKAEPAKAAAAALPEGDLPTQARKAAKSYAEVYGREGLKEQLKKFTEGTLADIPAEKLADFIAAVS